MGTAVLTVRVPEMLKEEVKRYKINVSEVIRRALEEEIRRKKLEELRRKLTEVSEFLRAIPREEWVRLIREGREEH